MSADLWLDERTETFSFAASFEGVCGLLIDLDLYIFSGEGELIDSQPLRRGRAVAALSEEELRGARMMIGPPIRDSMRGPVTMDAIRDRQGFEVGFGVAPERRSAALSAVPETVWRTWQQSGSWNRRREDSSHFDGFLFW
ncbi:hypothetical protein ACWJKU_17365 [Methylocaldum sp. MU1018]